MMTLSVHAIVLWAPHGGDKYIPETYSRNLLLLPQRHEQLQKHPQIRLLLAKSHPSRSAKGHSSPRSKVKGIPPVSNLSTFWWRNFLRSA